MKKIVLSAKMFFLILLMISLSFTVPVKANLTGPGDIDGDGDVDITDIVMAASQYNLTPENPSYNATIVEKADLALPNNRVINILDMVTIAYYYGTKY